MLKHLGKVQYLYQSVTKLAAMPHEKVISKAFRMQNSAYSVGIDLPTQIKMLV